MATTTHSFDLVISPVALSPSGTHSRSISSTTLSQISSVSRPASSATLEERSNEGAARGGKPSDYLDPSVHAEGGGNGASTRQYCGAVLTSITNPPLTSLVKRGRGQLLLTQQAEVGIFRMDIDRDISQQLQSQIVGYIATSAAPARPLPIPANPLLASCKASGTAAQSYSSNQADPPFSYKILSFVSFSTSPPLLVA